LDVSLAKRECKSITISTGAWGAGAFGNNEQEMIELQKYFAYHNPSITFFYHVFDQ